MFYLHGLNPIYSPITLQKRRGLVTIKDDNQMTVFSFTVHMVTPPHSFLLYRLDILRQVGNQSIHTLLSCGANTQGISSYTGHSLTHPYHPCLSVTLTPSVLVDLGQLVGGPSHSLSLANLQSHDTLIFYVHVHQLRIYLT